MKCIVNPWRGLSIENPMYTLVICSTKKSLLTRNFIDPCFFKLLQAIRFLGKQGLAFRGHNESSEAFQGNLYQLLLLQAEGFPKMNAWLQKREYISPKITNELIKLMGQKILSGSIDEVNSAQWYSVIVNEASDLSGIEQLSVTVGWISRSYEVHEDTLGLIEVSDIKAVTIFKELKDFLFSCLLPM